MSTTMAQQVCHTFLSRSLQNTTKMTKLRDLIENVQILLYYFFLFEFEFFFSNSYRKFHASELCVDIKNTPF